MLISFGSPSGASIAHVDAFKTRLEQIHVQRKLNLEPFGIQKLLETMLWYISVFRLGLFGTPQLFETLLCHISACTEPWFGDRPWSILEHRLRVSFDARRAKTVWKLFGERETTTSVVSDEKKVRAARRFYKKC